MERRKFLTGCSIAVVTSISGCTSGSLTDVAYTGRYSGDELPSAEPIFQSEEGVPLEQGETAAFLANSKSELREQMIADSTAIETWENKQEVAFLTAISIVLPIRSRLTFTETRFSGDTLLMNIKPVPNDEDNSGELGIHRMMIYWTQDYPVADEPTNIELIE